MVTRKILIIDDEFVTLEVVKAIFSAQFKVLVSTDAEAGLEIARREIPDVILLDLRMPKMDGIQMCEILRNDQNTRDIPILILTGSNERQERVSAFQMGADDFISKPYDREELQARVMSKLRRVEERNPKIDILSCGNLVYRKGQREVLIGDKRVPLSHIESSLLEVFLVNQDCALDRDMILKQVWKDVYVSDRTIDRHIVSLRKKLQDFSYEVVTIYGMGYALKKKPTTERAPSLLRAEP